MLRRARPSSLSFSLSARITVHAPPRSARLMRYRQTDGGRPRTNASTCPSHPIPSHPLPPAHPIHIRRRGKRAHYCYFCWPYSPAAAPATTLAVSECRRSTLTCIVQNSRAQSHQTPAILIIVKRRHPWDISGVPPTSHTTPHACIWPDCACNPPPYSSHGLLI